MSKSLLLPVSIVTVSTLLLYGLYRSYKKDENKDRSTTTSTDEKTITSLRLPVIDLSLFFDKEKDFSYAYQKECNKVANALHEYGICIIRDPRVNEQHNNDFLDMLESYFHTSDGVRDARPEYDYQVGLTPSNIERPRNHCACIKGAYNRDTNQPLSPCPPELDPKWRFFWRVGTLPITTHFPTLNMDHVIPPEFPEWKQVMDMWGYKMLDSLTIFAEMAAVGFHLPSDTFTSLMKNGPHLLAPTGSNFNEHSKLGTVLAGYHYDLNFLTIHGKSRFPGLYIWTRAGIRMSVEIPDSCLLIQAGKQMEYLTGGYIQAGFHEVVISEATVEVINRKKQTGSVQMNNNISNNDDLQSNILSSVSMSSLWRVSSTCFGHIQSDQILQPLHHFKTEESIVTYPPILAGDQVKAELAAISLATTRLH